MQQTPKQALFIGLLLLGLTGVSCGIVLLLASISVLEGRQAAQLFALLLQYGAVFSAIVTAFLSRRIFCGVVIGLLAAWIAALVISQISILRQFYESGFFLSLGMIVLVGVVCGSIGGITGRLLAEINVRILPANTSIRWRLGVVALATPPILWIVYLSYQAIEWIVFICLDRLFRQL